MPRLFLGNVDQSSHVTRLRGPRFVIERVAPGLVHTDGEPFLQQVARLARKGLLAAQQSDQGAREGGGGSATVLARRADQLSRKTGYSRTLDRQGWLRSELEVFELAERARPRALSAETAGIAHCAE